MFLRPREVVRFLSAHAFLVPGMTVADLGCGGGYVAILLAAATGPAGRVLAVDVQPEAVRETQELAEVFGYRNIETDQARLAQLSFRDGSVDLAYVSQVLFQNNKQTEVIIAEASRIIAPHGHLAIVEPTTDQVFRHGQIVPRDEIVAAASKSHLVLVAERTFDDNYTVVVFAHE